MSIAMKFDLVRDTARPALRELEGAVSPKRIAGELGPRLTKLVQGNFLKQPRNKNDWPTTNFYPRAAKATNWQADDQALHIIVNQIGIRQRFYGGEIKPVNAKALTFPAAPDAYGKRASEFSNLVIRFILDPASGKMRPALVEKPGTVKVKLGRKKKDGSRTSTPVSTSTGLVPLFWLASGALQSPNPAIIPTPEEFGAETDKGIENLLSKLK